MLLNGDTEPITEDSVMAIPSFGAAVALVADTVASLDILMMKNSDEGVPLPVKNDYRTALLNSQVNESMSAFNYKRSVVKDLLLYGRSFSYIDRSKNNINGIYPLMSKDMTTEVYTYGGYKYYGVYTYNSQSGSYNYDEDDLMNVISDTPDGITSTGIMSDYAPTLQLALAQRDYEKNLMANGAVPVGAVSSQRTVAQETLDRLKSQFNQSYTGSKNAGKTLFLEGGLEYKQISTNPDNMQLDSSKKAMLGEIARMFNIPETLINASANKYNSNEQNNLQFFQYCLKPILSSFEAAINKELLLESEKEDGIFFKFDTDTIMQNTFKEKVASYGALYDKGLISYDEFRNKFGFADIAGDDFINLSLGSVLYYPKTGEMKIPNLGIAGGADVGTNTPIDSDSTTVGKSHEKGAQKAPNTKNQQDSHQHKADNNALGGNQD